VVLDEQGHPSFNRLQNRALVTSPRDLARAALELPATMFAFDLLAFEGLDLRKLPLTVRKAALHRILPRTGPIRYADHVETHGAELFAEVRARGLEGLMAKLADAPYRSGRSGDWLKMRSERTGDFAIVGFAGPDSPASRKRGYSIALHLAARQGERWIYCGRAGSGLREDTYNELRARLAGDVRAKPCCSGALPTGRGQIWLEPRLVAEIRYLEFTPEGVFRFPVVLRIRDDKRPEECLLAGAHDPPPPEPAAAEEPARKVTVSNPDKLLWPAEGYRKRDLVDYYRGVARWILPYLRDRPLNVTRNPDGIAGKSFYQHDAAKHTPAWVRRERIWSPDANRDIDHFIVDDEDTLAYIANLACIPLHVWASRAGSLGQPDWCVLDLDPKGAPFAHVITLARALRDVATQLGLPSYAKTSGQAGMHVLLPLGGQLTHDQTRMLAELVARVVEKRHPDLSTTARMVSARGGRVYLDFGQNGQGRTIVGPFSVRAAPGATVSTTLTWDEVEPALDPRAFTIKTVIPRLAERGDPMAPLLSDKPDLASALTKLSELVGPAEPPAPRRKR
jgi:bifunctional non-homologous end joining protein LigD